MHLSDTELKQLVIDINSSLYCYDKDGCSYLKRSPSGELENVVSLRQFIECRLNLELFYIPELTDYVKYFDGHLFTVTQVDGLQEDKRRFDMVHANLMPDYQYFLYDPDNPVEPDEIVNQIKEILGGTSISFGYSQKKIKINVR